jgi:hypothetical protein
MRAVRSLEKDGRIEVEERKLLSFEECVTHYPSKTLNGEARRVRDQLLPALLQWTRQKGGACPRYTSADNERFHLESLLPEDRQSLNKKWLRLEPRLMALLPRMSRDDVNALFELIAKAKSIFETQGLDCRGAFVEHVQRCTARHLLPLPIANKITAFSNELLPPTDAGQLRLKSYIHAFADIPKYRGCSLKKETVEYLDRSFPTVVQTLPGYTAPPAKQTGFRRFVSLDERGPTHSKLLLGLFDQTVFQDFRFVRIK